MGRTIDSMAACVWRMNDAPAAGKFEQDVGRRTDFRVLNSFMSIRDERARAVFQWAPDTKVDDLATHHTEEVTTRQEVLGICY